MTVVPNINKKKEKRTKPNRAKERQQMEVRQLKRHEVASRRSNQTEYNWDGRKTIQIETSSWLGDIVRIYDSHRHPSNDEDGMRSHAFFFAHECEIGKRTFKSLNVGRRTSLKIHITAEVDEKWNKDSQIKIKFSVNKM